MRDPRELAYCGVFGAAALLLPVIFHVFHLGSVFMPMYLPLVTLAFFVGPLPAGLTALILPLISGAITGMPPFYPPVAFIMSIELAVMCSLIALLRRSLPEINELFILVPVLFLGRCIGVGLIYLMALFMKLPAKFVAGASLLSGWPGIILMLAAIPAIVRLSRMTGHAYHRREADNG
ncbi:MAG: hypothetical protein JW768_03565 [Chitinispirillaceae bacterium]|nr:hypothetical protein [Chitinispirillaceae bacterium]